MLIKKTIHILLFIIISSLILIACTAQEVQQKEPSTALLTTTETALQPIVTPDLGKPTEQTNTNPNIATPTTDPYPPPPYPAPPPDYTPPSPLPTITPIDNCDFSPPSTINVGELSSDTFIFSEPVTVPFAEEIVGAIDIIDWFADNQSLLVTTEGQSTHPIYKVNVSSGMTTQLAELDSYTTTPLWLEYAQGTLFASKLESDLWELKFTQGMTATSETWASDLGSIHVALHPNSQDLTVLLPGYPPIPATINQDRSTTNLTSRSVVTDYRINTFTAPNLAWSHDGSQLVHYGLNGAFLYTGLDQNECLLNLGENESFPAQWAIYATWSADNRYLAMIIAKGNQTSLPYQRSELLLVDLQTGAMNFLHHATESWDVVTGIGWHPISNKLILKVRGIQTEVNGFEIWQDVLFLLDTELLEAQRILPNESFHHSTSSGKISWSPDGNSIALICSGAPFCIVPVTQP